MSQYTQKHAGHGRKNNWKKQSCGNPFDAYAENPFAMPEGRAVTAEDTVDAQTAIYVVSRISGEGKDRRRGRGEIII